MVLAFFNTGEFGSLSVANDIGGEPLATNESAYCGFPA
jgi:hypothetical protein